MSFVSSVLTFLSPHLKASLSIPPPAQSSAIDETECIESTAAAAAAEIQPQAANDQKQQDNKHKTKEIDFTLPFLAPPHEPSVPDDLGAAVGWDVLDVIHNAEHRALVDGQVDPITHECFLDDDEEEDTEDTEDAHVGDDIVRLPCHTISMPCVMFAHTARQSLRSKAECPTCGHMYGRVISGSQPSGSMRVILRHDVECEGFPGHGTFEIQYNFPSGVQGAHHPSPGQNYSGTYREAFIPDTDKGRDAMRLLKVGFLRGELFTIGTSLTTGRQNTTVWGSIHQKTSTGGGTQYHGWPDASYFERLAQECAAKGIFVWDAQEELDARRRLRKQQQQQQQQYQAASSD